MMKALKPLLWKTGSGHLRQQEDGKIKSTSAVLHAHILFVFETNKYKYILEVFVRICIRIFASIFVRINVCNLRCIFVRIWTYTVCICTYPGSYLHVT